MWTALYLGPVHFGALNYANAIVAIFVTVSSLGMDNIVDNPYQDHIKI